MVSTHISQRCKGVPIPQSREVELFVDKLFAFSPLFWEFVLMLNSSLRQLFSDTGVN